MKKRAVKRSRTKRVKSGSVVITPRDLDLLILIGLCRYLTPKQAARDLFPNEDRCRRRIRQLFDASYLSVRITSSNRPNLVSLTSKGKALVAEHYPELAWCLKLAGPINQTGVEHHLLLVDARLYSAALGEKRRAPLAAWANAGGKLGQELGLSDYHLHPDGLAEFTTEQGSVFVAIEGDCGSEPMSVLADKLDRYVLVAGEGEVDALWLVVKGRTARLESIRALVQATGLEQWTRIMEHQHVLVRPVLEPAAGGGRAESPKTLIRTSHNYPENHGVYTPSPNMDRGADRGVDRGGTMSGCSPQSRKMETS